MCNSEALTKKLITGARNRHAQYAEGGLTQNIIENIVKEGWARIPTEKSFKARSASKTFDLWSLRRDFIFTEIITSAFRTVVRGKVRMLTTIRKIRKAWPGGEICCRFLANNRSMTGWALHPAGVLWVEFIAYKTTTVFCDLQRRKCFAKYVCVVSKNTLTSIIYTPGILSFFVYCS